MERPYYLADWILNKNTPDELRMVDISICIKYPDIHQFIDYAPRERVRRIDQHHQEVLKEILLRYRLTHYDLLGTKKRPGGARITIPFTNLHQFDDLPAACSIYVNHINHARKKKPRAIKRDKFYCVRMTVAIDIEGLVSKVQEIEERFVLIKARSFDEAYDKVEAQKESYGEPYLNPYGQFVRWRIDSYDDCFVTDASTIHDLNQPEGVEVYSKLKTRKRKDFDIWDGKSDLKD